MVINSCWAWRAAEARQGREGVRPQGRDNKVKPSIVPRRLVASIIAIQASNVTHFTVCLRIIPQCVGPGEMSCVNLKNTAIFHHFRSALEVS